MMNALVLADTGMLRLEQRELPALAEGYARIRLLAAALNHRDEWIVQGKYARIRYGVVLGSDGCGIVEAVNAEDRSLVGRRVVINPNQHWGNDPRVQSHDYSILGMPSDGTFAECIDVPLDRLHPAPEHLSDEEAAALPLAGLTAYRAVFIHGMLSPHDTVLVTGIGGGVAVLCLQFAVASGVHSVFVTTGMNTKLERAVALGASGGVLYTDSDWDQQLRALCGGFDLCIDSAGGEPFNRLLALANPAARIVVHGATLGAVPAFNMHRLFWKQVRVQGSTMGSDEDFRAMLQYVAQKQLRPVVDSVFPLQDFESAFERMRKREQFGKIVLRIAP